MSQSSDETENKKRFSLGGPKELLVILFLLVVFSRIGPLYAPLLLGAVVVTVLFYLIKTAFRFGTAVGWSTIVVLVSTCALVGYFQYSAHLKYEALLARLAEFDRIDIQRASYFPTSPVIQISAENNITDEDLKRLAGMPEFSGIAYIYLEDTQVTEEGLSILDQFPNLIYVNIESTLISDEALFQFEEEHPAITVIY